MNNSGIGKNWDNKIKKKTHRVTYIEGVESLRSRKDENVTYDCYFSKIRSFFRSFSVNSSINSSCVRSCFSTQPITN